MQREAIIHIGTTKTGSTSIQNVFNKYRDEILEQGALYPRSPGRAAHQMLTYATAGLRDKERNPEEAIWRGMEPTQRLEQFEAEFKQEMETLPAHVDRVIFSDERLSFMLRSTDDIKKLRARLAPYFQKFTVIAYLRRQDSYLASRYSELLRVGAVGEPDHKRKNTKRLQEYDYRRLLDLWAEAFGEHSIRPRIYERAPGRKFDSVDDFIVACRLDLTVPTDDSARLSNPSMNLAGQEVLREVGRLLQKKNGTPYVGGPLWRRIGQAVTKAVPGKGWLPTRAEAAEFMANFEAGNENIRARFFPERPTLFADETGAFPVEPMHSTDRERFEAACAAFLQAMALGAIREKAGERKERPDREAQRAARVARSGGTEDAKPRRRQPV
jgi:hypothetical protein